MAEKKMQVSVRPYFDILSVRQYAEKTLGFIKDTIHITLVSRILKNGDQAGHAALCLHIDGDAIDKDGNRTPLQATAWSSVEPTEEEVNEFASPVTVQDACLRWGSYEKDGTLVWAANPKLKTWVSADGEERSSQGDKYEWAD
jgi:hypothetical protein